MAERETIFEIRVSGAFAQVSAIDVETGTEVCVTTPASSARHDQHALARRKLNRALLNLIQPTPDAMAQTQNGDALTVAPPINRRGIVA